MTQGELFTAPALPTDVIAACPMCGARIAVQHFIEGGVESEFQGENGECFKCERPRRRKGASL